MAFRSPQDGQDRTRPVAKAKAKTIVPVKQESVEPRPGETDRQAQIRAMAEKIRREAREAANPSRPTPPPSTAPGGPEAPATRAAAPRGSVAKPPTSAPPPQKARVMSEAATQMKEDQDARKIEQFLPLLEEKVLHAEDEAEKVSILAAPLCMDADEELRDLQLAAVRDTERAVKAASVVAAATKREIERRKQEVTAMAPNAKQTGEAELEKLLTRLTAALAKLDEFKTVRKDHEAALAAGKLYGELAQRTSSLEIDCEKAAMMAEPIQKAVDEASASDVSSAELRETKEALRIAQATLAPTMRLIQGKITGLKGPMKTKLEELQARTEVSQVLLDKAQKTVEECQARAAAVPLLKQASERLQTVEEVLEKMRETESPFLMGIESMPADESQEILSRMEKAASLAHSAVADAHKYVSLKMVDVGRLGQSGETVKSEMERVKAKLDKAMERVKKFQADTLKRKRAALVDGIKSKVEEAANSVEKLKELGVSLAKGEADDISELLEQGLTAEIAAQGAVASARRELQERQQDLRPLEGGQPEVLKSSSDVLKTKVRMNYMEAELVKFRKIAKDFEEKQKVEKSLGDVHTSLNDAEMEVSALEAAALVWPKGEKPPEGEEKRILSVQTKLSKTTVAVEQKLQSAQGLELKQLRAVFGRLQRAQWKLDRVKEKVKELTRSISQQVVKGAVDLVVKAEKLVSGLGPAVPRLTGMETAKVEVLAAKAKVAMDTVAEGHKYLADAQNGGQLGLDAKVEFARLQLRWKAAERKGKAVSQAVAAHTEKLQTEAYGQSLEVLRLAAMRDSEKLDADALFSEMADGGEEISLKQFQDFFAIRAPEVSAEQASLALKSIAPHGLNRRLFAAALCSYFRCAKEITITQAFEIATAKKVRKLEVGELLEAFGAVKNDTSLGLERVQCRVLRDGSTGWVTIKSNSGTVYLERAKKPYVWCSETQPLYEEKKVGSHKLRDISPGEVLELVQGPMQDNTHADQRVRGMACHEGDQGWLQIKDKSGTALAKASARVFKCIEAIAMTDVPDFENCNMIRRVEKDEALELLPDKAVVPEDGGSRKRFRACRDGKEGWVTTDGSQGTVYVKPAPKHYICAQAAPLHAGLGAESSVVRVLMPGEAFAAFEEPKEVAGTEKQTIYLAKPLGGLCSEGWLFSESSSGSVGPWAHRYKALKAAPLTKRLVHNEAAEVIEVLRLLEVDEILDASEPPTEDSASGLMRVRVVARKDKAVGWVTVREGSSADSMLIVPDSDEISAATLAAAPSTPPGDDAPVRGFRPSFADDRGGKGSGKWSKGGGKGKRW